MLWQKSTKDKSTNTTLQPKVIKTMLFDYTKFDGLTHTHKQRRNNKAK